MNEVYHIPAMLQETIEGLNIQPQGVYVDVTFGGGGHSRAIIATIEKLSAQQRSTESTEVTNSKLYSFDQDLDAFQAEQKRAEQNEGQVLYKNPRWQFVHSNFRYLRNWMDYYDVEQIDGILADLGVSFHHFDRPERGFSFRYSAPLDMRMNQTAKLTAAHIINTYEEEELARIFWLYGELKSGRGIAKNICRARNKKAIERTEELVSIVLGRSVENLMSTQADENGFVELNIPSDKKKDLARLFQALRIEVNDEMGALREMLVAARDLLKSGGRIAILTYHSLEDRLVKNFLRSGNLEGTIEKDFYGNILTPFEVIEKGLMASDDEVERNPRSRSAKLRIAQKR